MKCSEAQRLIFRQIDRELPGRDSELLGKHLSQCSDCARDFQLLSIPRRVAPAIKPIEPSDFFCQTLRTRIENEARNAIVVQQFLGLARGFIPSLAAVPLPFFPFSLISISPILGMIYTLHIKMHLSVKTCTFVR